MGDVIDDLYSFEPCNISTEILEEVTKNSPKMGRRAPVVEDKRAQIDKDQEKKIQQAHHQARLAEKRAVRTTCVNEAEKFKQEASFNSKLAEKRVSRGKMSPMVAPQPGEPKNSPRWDFTNGAEQVIKEAVDKGETGAYVATYDRLLQESTYEERLHEKRKSISHVRSPPSEAPHGDSLDQLKSRICLTESRGASPEPNTPKAIMKPVEVPPWQNPSRGIR